MSTLFQWTFLIKILNRSSFNLLPSSLPAMGFIWIRRYVFHCYILLILYFQLIHAETDYYPVANLSSSWINNDPWLLDYRIGDYQEVFNLVPVLIRENVGPASFVCGFFCNYDCDGYLFAVLIFPSVNGTTGTYIPSPRVVWSANRNSLVGVNATLELTQEGDLVLGEDDVVWSTDTSGKSVVGMNLTETGNLVLFDSNNSSVWQSFDHPTDSLVPEQKLILGEKLTASVSKEDWSSGLISLSAYREGLVARVESNPPQNYSYVYYGYVEGETRYVIFKYEGLFLSSDQPIREFPHAASARYMKLEHTGQLRFYEYAKLEWKVLDGSLLAATECQYPLVCGKYGVCSGGQCSCPGPVGGETDYFKPINFREPDLGCSESTPLSCEASRYHSLLELKDVVNTPVFMMRSARSYDIESCKQACLKNCSCKAVFLEVSDSTETCYLLPEVFSLTTTRYLGGNLTTFIKVQNVPKEDAPSPDISNIAPVPFKKTGRTDVILVSGFGALFSLFLIIIACRYILLKRKYSQEDEDFLQQVPGLPTRFSHESLVVATENFSQKLGEGGFGCVFKGVLSDGTKVAVKRLSAGIVQSKDSFLAEVETIGHVHHMNLVRLIGYCTKKSNRFLVYEYMCNGSLDKWIFCRNQEHVLDWQTRRKIILDIAKGLAYLHEDCQKKIVHLDIKPQNILLDENFNAKVSDFGLSKLIDKDQSQVVTSLRGTVGYLAPEWISSSITEKVDVYSFGVVVLEILCGRKNLDRSQPEDDMHLLCLMKKKVREDRMLELVDKNSEDMMLHGAEVVEMIKLAGWCLQKDIAKRPSMSMVLKVLEGVVNVEDDLDYSFFNPEAPKAMETLNNTDDDVVIITSLVLPSILSGPR